MKRANEKYRFQTDNIGHSNTKPLVNPTKSESAELKSRPKTSFKSRNLSTVDPKESLKTMQPKKWTKDDE